jgi:hypothetical protein
MLRWGVLIAVAGLLLLGSVLLWTSSSHAQTGATVWWDTGMAKLRRDNAGTNADPIPAVINTGPIDISAARNEFEPFQIFVAAGASAVAGVNVTVSNLSDGRGGVIVASDATGKPKNVVIYREHYLNITSRSSSTNVPAPSPTPKPEISMLGWVPDGLVPKVDEYFGEVRQMPFSGQAAFPFTVNAAQKQGIWVDVYVPQGTHAGLYTGTVTVTYSGGTLTSFPLNLKVRDFELPSTPSLKTAYAAIMGTDGITRGHFVDDPNTNDNNPTTTADRENVANPNNPEHMRLQCLYNKEMLLHRLSNETIIWPSPKWNGTSIDWNLPAAAAGCTEKYPDFLNGASNLPSGKLPGAKVTRARLREDRTWMGQTLDHAARPDPALDPLNETPGYGSLANYANYLQQYIVHFNALGWDSQLFHYTWDEPAYRPIETFSTTDPKVWRCDTAWSATIHKDTFDRGAAGVPTPLGTNWDPPNQVPSGLEIFNNEVRSNPGNAGTAVFDRTDLGNNQVVSVNCKMTASGNACGVVARRSDADNYYYARLDAGQDNVVIYRREGAASNLLASVPVSLSFNVSYRLRLVVQGVKEQGVYIWVYVDTDPLNPATAPAISLVDHIANTSALNSGSYVGLWSWSTGPGAVTFDNFSANTASNQWTGLYAKANWFKANGVDVPVLTTNSRQGVEGCIGDQIKDQNWRKYIDYYVVANKHMHGNGGPDGLDGAGGEKFNRNLRGTYDATVISDTTVPKKELWWYQACGNHDCGGQGESAFVTPMADLPNIYSRMFEWLTYRYQVNTDVNPAVGYAVPGPQTELYFETTFAYSQWNGTTNSSSDPWNKIYYFTGNGDGTFFYPGRPDTIGGTTHIPIPSIRLKMVREGIEDYEYLTLAEAKKDQQGVDGKGWIYTNILFPYLADDFKDSRTGLDSRDFITYGWNRDPGSPTSATGVLKAREELAKVLAPDFSDNFDRTNNTAFGSNWTETLPDLEIFSNQVRTVNIGNKEALFIPSVGADQDVSALVKISASGNSGAVIARRVDANNFYRARLDVAAGNIALYKTAGGTSTLLGTVASRPLSYNTYYRVRLVVKGNSLKVYFNYETTPAITVTDGSFASGGTGVRAFTAAANTVGYDNFALTKALQ